MRTESQPVRDRRADTTTTERPTLEQVVDAACEASGVGLQTFFNGARTRSMADARHIAAHIANVLYGYSQCEISRRVYGGDPPPHTVSRQVAAAKRKLGENPVSDGCAVFRRYHNDAVRMLNGEGDGPPNTINGKRSILEIIAEACSLTATDAIAVGRNERRVKDARQLSAFILNRTYGMTFDQISDLLNAKIAWCIQAKDAERRLRDDDLAFRYRYERVAAELERGSVAEDAA